ncbi:multidrug and toxin extrusion protein 1-like [Actinia tenebrosa]|uniref:Multidrug and toxin extrusion protein n=1 Tax=Actinia tenebrosa TaxID=6105 RepID=A0A6P8HEU1_ACTTE|nr:multidrug and toxin extrusion protein 1-like [Actinia tenebrosa]
MIMGYKDALSSMAKTLPISTFKNLFQLIWPLYLSLLIRRFVGPINAAFAGRVGTKELGAVGISYGLLAVTATGLGSGLAVSYETMAAKALGARQYHMVGILLQKAFLLVGCLCIFVTSLWFHVCALLRLIGIPVDVAEKSEEYLLMYIPSMLGIFLFRILRAYLIVQRNVIPSSIVAFIGVAFLVPFNYACMYLFHWGVSGIAIASDFSYFLMVLLMILYILITGIYEETWPGLTARCFLQWKKYLTLAIPGALSFLLKSSVHEIALIAIGRLGEVETAAQTGLFTTTKAMLTLPFAIAMPMNINIAKNFGERNPEESRRTAIVGGLFNLVISLVFAGGLLALKDVIGGVFTNDVAVQTLISHVTPFAAFSFLLESITTVMFVICLSLRLQLHSTVIYFISCYLIGLPLGISLALHKKELSLLWCGLAVGFCVQFFMFSVLFFFQVDFERISEERAKADDDQEKEKTEYSPVKTVEDESCQEEGTEKSDAENLFAEDKDDTRVGDDEEKITLKLIGKRFLIFGIAIFCLIVSIVIRVKVGL